MTFNHYDSGSTPEGLKSLRSSIGWAELWRCLGCKFESYLEQKNEYAEIGKQVLLRPRWLYFTSSSLVTHKGEYSSMVEQLSVV